MSHTDKDGQHHGHHQDTKIARVRADLSAAGITPLQEGSVPLDYFSMGGDGYVPATRAKDDSGIPEPEIEFVPGNGSPSIKPADPVRRISDAQIALTDENGYKTGRNDPINEKIVVGDPHRALVAPGERVVHAPQGHKGHAARGANATMARGSNGE